MMIASTSIRAVIAIINVFLVKMFRYDNIKKEEVQEEPENNNLEKCDVCEMMSAANQTCKTESEGQSTRLTARRNPSRSAKMNIIILL